MTAGRRRVVRWSGVSVGLVLFYALIAGVVLPRAIRAQAEKRLTALVGGPVTIGKVAFHPFALRARVTDFRLAEPDGRSLLAWSNVVVDVEWESLWRRALVVAGVEVDRLRLDLRRESGNRLNVLELVKRVQAAQPASSGSSSSTQRSGLFPVVVERFGFTNGVVAFRDEMLAEPFTGRLEPIDFEVHDLSTVGGRDGRLTLTANGDSGERFELATRLRIEPLSVEGTVRGAHIHLPRPRQYLAKVSPVQVAEGAVEFTVPFRIVMGEGPMEAAVTNMAVAFAGLSVVEGTTNAPLASIDGLRLDAISASWTGRVAEVGSVRVDGGKLFLRRGPSTAATAAAAAPKPAASEVGVRGLMRPEAVESLVRGLTDWRLRLGEAQVSNLVATLEDTSIQPPVRLSVEGIGLRLANVSNQTNAAPVQFGVNLRWPERGAVSVQGEGTVFPAQARVAVDWQDLALAPFAPYLAQVVRLELNRGSLSGKWETEYGGAASGPLLRGKGRVAFADFAATETGTGTDFIRWDAVEANGLSAAVEPGRLELEDLAVRKLQTSLVVMTNGQLNVLQLLRETRELGENATTAPAAAPKPARAAADASAKPPAAAQGGEKAPDAKGGAASSHAASPVGGDARPFWEQWPVRLGRLRLEKVALFASDQFYGGGFRTSVESLDGEIRNMALPASEPASIDLTGRLSAVSGFTAKGTLNPDPARFGADLAVSTRRADLAQFTPYSVRFAGYPVTKGELTADVHYRIEGDNLKAENKLRLDQFTLGAKTKSPDAVDLPLKLGVALLKDAEGKIELDVPLSGTLSDPQFRIAPVIWQVVKNLIVKAATAPFRLLGSLFGGGQEEELEYVDFDPGSAEVRADQTNRLRTLVRALQGRPQLSLAILPGFDPAADRPALATNKVELQLKALRGAEFAASGALVPPVADIGLPPEEHDRLLPLLYVRLFGALPTTAFVPGVTNANNATNATSAVPTNMTAVTIAPTATTPASSETPPPVAPVWTPAQLKQRLVDTCVLEPEDFKALARRRAEAVQAVLAAPGAVAADRLSVDPESAGHAADGKARVAFRLE